MAISAAVELQIAIGDGKLSKSPKRTLVRVVNRGRRACTLGSIGLVRKTSFIGSYMRRLFRPRDRLTELHLNGLPKRLEYEEVWTGVLDWKSFYLVPYGEKVAFYAEDTLGRRGFTGRIRVDDLKDPDFENEGELPYTIDEKVRNELTRYKTK